MNITIINSQQDLKVSLSSIKACIRAIFEFYEINTDEIIIHLVKEKKIQQLHDHFFQDPTVTDCISFPFDRSSSDLSYSILGEIFICPKTAIEYSKKNRLNPYNELLLYLIHGILHLLGYNDLNQRDRVKMRKEEKKCLQFLLEKHLEIRTPKKSSSSNE